jgi:hypothetical protein
MAVEKKVLTGTITGSGSTDFTSPGFGTPDAAIVFFSLANTANNPATTARISIGFWDGTTQYCVGSEAADNQTSSNTSGVSAAYVGALFSDRAWSISNITDGVRISWVSGAALSVSLYVTVILLGGLTNKKVGSVDLGSSTSAINVTAPGFPANLVFLATIAKDGAGTRDGQRLSFGAAHINSSGAVSQGSVALYSEDALADTKSGCYVNDSAAITGAANDGVGWQQTVTANASGFTLTPSASAAGVDGYYLAIQLPDPNKAHVAIDDARTSAGTEAYTGAGFTPEVLILVAGLASAVDTITQAGSFMLGAGDATTERCVVVCDEDAQAVSDTESYCEAGSILHLRNDAGTANAVATIDSFDADGWTLNYSDGASSAWKMLAIAIGDSRRKAINLGLLGVT